MKNRTLAITLLFLSAQMAHAETLLLSGKISSSQKQRIMTPRATNWNIQIQWMEEEGKVVAIGDPVLVFDGSSENERLEQNRERLESLKLELKQQKFELEQKVIEAKGALKIAKLQVEKARIEASIPASELSQYEKGRYDLALQRNLMGLIKAEEALNVAQQELKTGLQKKQIEILKVEEDSAYLRSQLSKLKVEAQVNGPVSYAMHPHNNQKIAAGTNVQAGWPVMFIQSKSGLQIESWLHEMDVERLKPGQAVEISMDAFPGRSFSGIVAHISSQAEKKQEWSRSVYFPVTIKFDQLPDISLVPGMSVRIVAHSAETSS